MLSGHLLTVGENHRSAITLVIIQRRTERACTALELVFIRAGAAKVLFTAEMEGNQYQHTINSGME